MADRPRVRTYADVLAEYKVHREPKSAGIDGQICGIRTRGLLERVPVGAENVAYVGKESNRLEEREMGLVHAKEDFQTEYGQLKDLWGNVVEALRTFSVRELMISTGLSRRAIQRIRSGGAQPRWRSRALLVALVHGTEANRHR